MKRIAFVLLFAGCAARAKYVDMGSWTPLVDSLYQRIGNRELLLCLDAKLKGNTWKVTGVTIPEQKQDSNAVEGGGCNRSQGDLHNHPKLGGDYRFQEIYWFSETDEKGFDARRNLRFTVMWFAPGKFTAQIKKVEP